MLTGSHLRLALFGAALILSVDLQASEAAKLHWRPRVNICPNHCDQAKLNVTVFRLAAQ
jgi:hypothetical protein